MTIDALIREAVRDVVREELEQLRAEIRAMNRASSSAKYLTTAEAATRASVTAATIRDWVHAKKLSRCGSGRSLRIRASELKALLEEPEGEVERAVVLELRRLREEEK